MDCGVEPTSRGGPGRLDLLTSWLLVVLSCRLAGRGGLAGPERLGLVEPWSVDLEAGRDWDAGGGDMEAEAGSGRWDAPMRLLMERGGGTGTARCRTAGGGGVEVEAWRWRLDRDWT